MKNSQRVSAFFCEYRENCMDIVIPDYQRLPAWDKTTCVNFINTGWDRRDKNRKDNYFGVIYIRESSDKTIDTKHKYVRIVEGQQRLTVFCLVLLAFKNCAKKYGLYDEEKYPEIWDACERVGNVITHVRTGEPILRLNTVEEMEAFNSVFSNKVDNYKDTNIGREYGFVCNEIDKRFRKFIHGDITIDNLKSDFYDCYMKTSIIKLECDDDVEEYEEFVQLNTGTPSPTPSDIILAKLSGELSVMYNDDEVNLSWNQYSYYREILNNIKMDSDKTSFFCKYIYNKTGVWNTSSKIVRSFDSYQKEKNQNILDVIKDINDFYIFYNSVKTHNIKNGSYSDNELIKLNQFIERYIQYEQFDDIVNILGDLVYSKKCSYIPIDDLISIMKIFYSIYIRSSITNEGNHKGSYFVGVVKKMKSMHDSGGYKNWNSALVDTIKEISTQKIRIFTNDEFRTSLLSMTNNFYNKAIFPTLCNIINNNGWDNEMNFVSVYNDCNKLQKDHIKPKDSFKTSEESKYMNMLGNLAPVPDGKNASWGKRPYEQKRDDYCSCELGMNKYIGNTYEHYGIEEILSETKRRANILIKTTDIEKYIDKEKNGMLF